MKITATIKDKSDCFYEKLDAMSARESFDYLTKNAYGTYAIHGLSLKIGNGSFRDKVDLNSLIRSPVTMTYKREPRRGYYLVTFEVSKA